MCVCARSSCLHSRILVTTPVPIVFPPSLRVNRWLTSRGMSCLRVRVNSVSSPGITISFPYVRKREMEGDVREGNVMGCDGG